MMSRDVDTPTMAGNHCDSMFQHSPLPTLGSHCNGHGGRVEEVDSGSWKDNCPPQTGGFPLPRLLEGG